MPSQTRYLQNSVGGAWADPANAIGAPDNNCASNANNKDTHVWNFVGSLFTIPAAASITGIQVTTYRASDDGDEYYGIALQGTGGVSAVKMGTTGGSPACADYLAEALGADGDLWAETFTAAHVNGANFQVTIQQDKSGKQGTTYVTSVLVEVFYELASEDLLGIFTIQAGLTDDSAELLGIFSARRDGSEELFGIFSARRDGSENLLGIFNARRDALAELLGVFEGQVSQDLLGIFEARRDASENLLGIFTIRRDGSEDLLGVFKISKSGSAELLGVFTSRQAGSAELFGIFEGQASQSLLGIFEVRRDGSQELLGIFSARRDGSEELFGIFSARRDGSEDLLGIFEGQVSQSLLAIFDIQPSGSAELLAIFEIGGVGSANLLGIFDVRRDGSEELLGIFSIRRDGSEDFLGVFEAQQDGSQELLGIFIIRASASAELLGIFTARRDGSAELLGIFDGQASVNLLGVFDIQPSGSADLLGIFSLGTLIGSEDLLGIFDSQATQDLLGVFIIRGSSSQVLFSETCVHTPRVAQDLDDSTWVEYDAGGLLDHDCNWSWWTDVRRDTQNTAHMKTVTGGLGSDFFHEFTLNMYAIQAAVPGVFERICPWAAHLEMTSQDYYAQDDLKIAALVVLAILDEPNEYQLRLIEKGGDSDTMLTHWVNFQDRYIVIYKQGTSLIANVYQDAAHTILEDSAEITLSGDLDFLYVSMPMSWGVAGAGVSSGLVDPIFGSMENLLCGFSVLRTGTPAELLGIFNSGQGSTDLLGEFIVERSGSQELAGEFIARHDDSAELLSIFRVRCSRRFADNWQRKMWHDGAYYWRARYCPTHDRLEFEYIAEAGLAGNVWTENVNARINAAGFTCECADFTVRGAGEGIPTTIHYSDGVDTWIAESDESSVLGWTWQLLTKVFDGTPNDWYRRVNLAANRTTPTPRLWAVAVFYDDLPDGKQWMKARRQTDGGDITGWDGEVNVSNINNTSTIYGCSARSMGDAGVAKNDVIFLYKEGIAVRSRYYDGDWDDPIEDVDTTTLAGRAAWDLEHVEMLNGDEMAHFIYVDADGSIQWRERDPGAASVWSAASQLEVTHSDHFGVGIVDHGNGWSWCVWVHGDVLEYRLHICLPEVWYPLLANPALIFDPATDAVITTSTIEQPQTPDAIHAGDAVPICWIGQTAPGAPCGLGWGILQGAAEEDLPAEFIARHSDSVELPAGFDGQVSLNLPAEFILRHSDSVELPAEFESAQGSENLLGVLIIRHSASVELHGAFDGQAVINLPAEFTVIRSTQKILPAEFVIRQTSEELPGQFISRPEDSAELLGILDIVHSIDLDALFEAQHIDSEELLGVMVSRHESFQNLPAEFLVYNADASNLLGGFIIRHSFTGTGVIIARDPHALFNYNVDVGTGFLSSPGSGGADKQNKVGGEASHAFRIKYIPDRYDYISFGWKYRYPILPGNIRDLRGTFTVMQGGAAQLPCGFTVGLQLGGEDLKCSVIIIPPPFFGSVTSASYPNANEIRSTFQRKIWYAAGRHWIFWHAGNLFMYSTSKSGLAGWANTMIKVHTGTDGELISTWFDDTYVYYVLQGNPGRFRRGTFNSNGTITWDAEQSLGVLIWSPTICVDIDGYPWIGYRTLQGGGVPRLITSDTNDGTWSTRAGFPVTLNANPEEYAVMVLPQKNAAKINVIYLGSGVTTIYGREASAGGVEAEQSQTITLNYAIFGYRQAGNIGLGDEALIAYSANDKNKYFIRFQGTALGFTAEQQLSSENDELSGVALVKVDDNTIYAIWQHRSSDLNFYRKSTDGGLTWADEGGNTALNAYTIWPFPFPYSWGGFTRTTGIYQANKGILAYAVSVSGGTVIYSWLYVGSNAEEDLKCVFAVGVP